MAGCCGGCNPHPPPPPPPRPGQPTEIPPNRVIIKNFKGTIDKNQLFNKENVNWLEVVSGEIDSISEDFLFATTGLQRLIITGNKTFPKLTKNLFRNYPKLTYIDICYNDALDIDEDAFTELKDLKTLMLDEGRYTHVVVNPKIQFFTSIPKIDTA